MRSADYWRQRAEAVEAQAHDRAAASVALIEQWFMEAQRGVQKEIESWYARFAGNNSLSLADARKLLNSRELEEFRWDVQQYIKAGESGDPRWAKQLENASAKFHVSRLEAVQLQMQQQLERLYGNQLDEMESLFRQVTSDTYTHTAFDLMQGLGIGWDITAPDTAKLDKLLSTPWTTDGATFRDRCWTMKEDLRAELQKELVQGLMTGKPPLEISTGIQKRFGVSKYKAARLVNTETTYFNAVSTRECYRDLDVERVEIIGTLDDTTCEVCGGMDGKVIPVTQYEPGVTVPPYHPNCRCTTAPAIDPEFAGERAARNEDGEVYYVPADMTYPEWKKKFVEDGDKSDMMQLFAYTTAFTDENNEFALNSALKSYRKFLKKVPEKSRLYLRQSLDTVTYSKEKLPDDQGCFGYIYESKSGRLLDKIVYDPDKQEFSTYDFIVANTHELSHRVDRMFVQSWDNEAFVTALEDVGKKIDEMPETFISICDECDRHGFLSDILSAGCKGRHDFLFGHKASYWDEHCERPPSETFANLFSLTAIQDSEKLTFLEDYFPELMMAYYDILEQLPKRIPGYPI